jgi:hypothetical protein
LQLFLALHGSRWSYISFSMLTHMVKLITWDLLLANI